MVFGHDEAEALTLTLPDLFTASSATAAAEMLEAGVGDPDGGTTHRFEAEGRRKDGSAFPCELTVSSWRAGDARFMTASQLSGAVVQQIHPADNSGVN